MQTKHRRLAVIATVVSLGCSSTPEAAPDAGPDADPNAPACWTNPTYSDEFEGHRYRVSATAATYDDAVAECARDGAHLVVLNSTAESQFVEINSTGDPWLGHDDTENEGLFFWLHPQLTEFFSWAAFEPNNGGMIEDCAVLLTTGVRQGLWDDKACGQPRTYTCECDPGHRATPLPRCLEEPSYEVIHGRRYRLTSSAQSWNDSQEDCASDASHLIAISDLSENNALAEFVAGEQVWIGLGDAGREGQYSWPVGMFRFTNWIAGTPNPTDAPTQDCVAMLADGTWDDLDCTLPQRAICECDPQTNLGF